MLMTLVIVVTMIWMWVAERNEREGILAEHADARAALAGANLIEPTRRRRHVLVDWKPDDEVSGRRRAGASRPAICWCRCPRCCWRSRSGWCGA